MKAAHNRVNMLGQKYNSWLILEHSHTSGKIAYYKAKCLECGVDHIVDGRNVRNGLSKRCVKCGTTTGHTKQVGKAKNKKTIKQIAEEYLFKSKRKGAAQRGYNWSITLAEFTSLIYKTCTYCGTIPNTTTNPTFGHKLIAARREECFITYNGLDRVDSNKGYELSNVVTCCAQCNRAKLDYSVDDFLAWARKLVAFQDRKA